MAEGGMYPWKVQTIKVPPIANYRTMALGEPPAGWEWSHNTTTREWTLREREVLAVPLLTTTTTAPSTTTTPLMEDSSLVPLAHAEPIGMVESSSTTNPNTSTSSRVRHHHVVTESDTFQGICLKYKITATQLRQANCFSGSNLKLGPKVLHIPHIVYTQPATSHELLVLQQQQKSLQSVQENKIALFLSKCNNNNTTSTAEDGLVVTINNKFNQRNEIRAYLEMNDWNVDAALDEMRADYEFEQSHSRTTNTHTKSPPPPPPPEQQKQPLLRWC